ncbi:predicted protein [Aspergillus terreus NIH2624]|uniref:Zn(2)-C6 fungal-type domain-containing protein n=1 Tax=Aspergillus terreus (strain NIH 2624 / FGSC A1156) TaxID=341663 RepID=Q0CYA3_ASPTN|nr:uncharacterized protein ATEG_01331 [Aspergillus terreus NIH2624]EAU38088.1 predicted protein [Aspergillus terreus NIH2624]
MVGVPRSGGCPTCLSRKVKCDETRPGCQRCTKKGLKCPGYTRPLDIRTQKPPFAAPPRDRKHPKPASWVIARKPTTRPLLLPQITIDEVLAPNLAYEALSMQTKESFQGWLMYYFPRVYFSFKSRVDVDWMDFLRDIPPAQFPQALMWAIRALITFQMGTLQGNEMAIYSARHMYGRGLCHLRALLQTPAALSDECLASCILLGGYEILDGSSERSWISHTHGIRYIMSARGAAAHKSGIGRTLMLSFRPFLISEAFVMGEHCFLGDAEWTSLSNHALEGDGKKGKKSALGKILDNAFDEFAKCPGYYAVTRNILASPTDPDNAVMDPLLSDIAHAKERLRQLRAQLDIDQSMRDLDSFSGSVPATYVDSTAQLISDGINSILALLGQLSTILEADQSRRSLQRQARLVYGANSTPGQDPWRLSAEKFSRRNDIRQPLLLCDPTAFTSSTRPIGDALDRFSLDLGMGSVSTNASQPSEFAPTPVWKDMPP